MALVAAPYDCPLSNMARKCPSRRDLLAACSVGNCYAVKITASLVEVGSDYSPMAGRR